MHYLSHYIGCFLDNAPFDLPINSRPWDPPSNYRKGGALSSLTLGFCLPVGFSPTRYFNLSMGISHAASYLRIVLSMRLLATMYPPRSLGQSPLTSELAPACPLGVPPPSIRRSQPGGHSPWCQFLRRGYSGQSAHYSSMLG